MSEARRSLHSSLWNALTSTPLRKIGKTSWINEQWLELLHPITSEGSGPKYALGLTCPSPLARTRQEKCNGTVVRATKASLLRAAAIKTCQGSDEPLGRPVAPLFMMGLVVNVSRGT